MYDYRKDLLSIINNIDASEDGLLRGRKNSQCGINLVNALPSDNNPHHTHLLSNNMNIVDLQKIIQQRC